MIFSNFNNYWFAVINGWSHRSAALDWLGIFIADYLPVLIVLSLLWLLFSSRPKQSKNKLMVVLASTASIIAVFLVKPIILLFYAKPRPFVALPHLEPLTSVFKLEDWQSFPSGHSLFFFSLAMVICLFNKRVGLVYFGLAVLIGFARIYTGVHWPLDILAGAVIGMVVGCIAFVVYSKYA